MKTRFLLRSSGEEKRGKSPGEPPCASGQEDHLVSHVHLDSISKGYITTLAVEHLVHGASFAFN